MASELTVYVHDQRLAGGIQRGAADLIIEVNEHIDLGLFVQQLAKRKISRLDIFCHGGPARLELCKQEVCARNVHKMTPLKGRVAGTIWLRGCEVASGREGKDFCLSLSRVCETQVVAAEELQWYGGSKGDHQINFGDWEGDVLVFTPDGYYRRVHNFAPSPAPP